MSAAMTTRTPQGTPTASPLIHPMDEFYAQAGRPMPRVERVEAENIPEPQRSLLVHEGDMTSALTNFHKSDMHLEVIRREMREDVYTREVVLLLDGSDQAVEFGAIRIYLSLLPSPARRAILDEHLPLGQILKEFHVRFESRPKAFLRIESDDFINRSLRLHESALLYGRRNTLTDSQQRPLAEIVEILPPTPNP